MDDFLDSEEREEFENIEVTELVSRYEEMIKNNDPIYLSLDDYENLFMYYTLFHDERYFYEEMNLEMAGKVIQDGIKNYPDAPLLQMFCIYYKYLTKEYHFVDMVKLLECVEIPEYEKVDILYFRADIYKKVCAELEAISVYEELLTLVQTKEEKIGIYVDMIFLSKHMITHDVDKVCDYLEKLTALDPLLEGEHLARLGYETPEVENGVNKFPIIERYVSRNLFSAMGWFDLGQKYLSFSMYEQAENALDNAIALSDGLEMLIAIGNLYRRGEKAEEALKYYQEALERFPDSRDFYLELGDLYCTMGQISNALSYYKAFLEVHPDSYRALSELGYIYCKEEKYETAIYYLEKARKVGKNYDPSLVKKLTKCMVAVGRGDEMTGLFERMATEYYCIYPDMWLNYSDYYVMCNNYPMAVEVLNRGLYHIKEDDVLILYRMANYYFIMGDYTNGSAYLKMALIKEEFFVDFFLSYDTQTANLPVVIDIIKELRDNNLKQ
jgi:tetratricopeptide (TPR) repeat protein